MKKSASEFKLEFKPQPPVFAVIRSNDFSKIKKRILTLISQTRISYPFALKEREKEINEILKKLTKVKHLNDIDFAEFLKKLQLSLFSMGGDISLSFKTIDLKKKFLSFG